MNVTLFAVSQSDSTEEHQWSGTFGQYADDNLLDAEELAEVAVALKEKGEYWTGGGAQQLMVLRIEPTEVQQ